MHSRTSESTALRRIAIVIAAMSLVGCSKTPPSTPASSTVQTPATGPGAQARMVRPPWHGTVGDTAWWARATRAHPGYPPASARAAWAFESPYGSGTFLIPEYNDAQHLYSDATSTTYGPMAKVFASPYLSALSSIDQFNAYGPGGALVGVVDVTPPDADYPLNDAYTRLGLTAAGDYCLALAHTTNSMANGWSGFIYPVDANGYCQQPQIPTTSASALPAGVTALSVQTSGGGGGGATDGFPSVARWGHDSQGRPVILVRCLSLTCEFLPSGSVVAGPWFAGSGPQWNGKLWHDEQRLAIPDGSGHWKPSDVRASVVPEKSLDRRNAASFTCAHQPCQDDNEGWQRVATINLAKASGSLDDTPYGKGAKWNMKLGKNILWLRKNGVGPDDADKSDWDARITDDKASNPTVLKIVKNIARHGHWDVIVAGTARFAFGNDEGIWVSCAMGCCYVDAE